MQVVCKHRACLHFARRPRLALLQKSWQCILHLESVHKATTGVAASWNACADYKGACLCLANEVGFLTIVVNAQDDIAHVVVMPNVTLSKLEGFVADLIASRARAATTAALRIAADARAIRDDELRGASDDDC